MKKLVEIIANIEEKLTMQIALAKKVLSLQEAAHYLNLSEAMLYKMTSERTISHSKPSGKKIFFDKEDLDKWALSNKVKTVLDIASDVIIGKSGSAQMGGAE